MDAFLHRKFYDVIRALFFSSELIKQIFGVSSSKIW